VAKAIVPSTTPSTATCSFNPIPAVPWLGEAQGSNVPSALIDSAPVGFAKRA
jgi:hypothetical protein